MKRNTVIFDIDGLISYPDFTAQIISPLEEKGVNILFWTFNSEVSAGERLHEIGLEKYDVKGRCIGVESLGSVDNALYLYRTQGDVAPIVKRMSLAGLSTDDENLQRFLQECNNYSIANTWGVRCKYPPMLGEDNYLLVESDCAMYIPSTNKIVRDRLASADRGLALLGTHSLIQVPEHPDVWQKNDIGISPEEVVQRLKHELSLWDGGHIVRDVGSLMGIYQEGIRPYFERR